MSSPEAEDKQSMLLEAFKLMNPNDPTAVMDAPQSESDDDDKYYDEDDLDDEGCEDYNDDSKQMKTRRGTTRILTSENKLLKKQLASLQSNLAKEINQQEKMNAKMDQLADMMSLLAPKHKQHKLLKAAGSRRASIIAQDVSERAKKRVSVDENLLTQKRVSIEGIDGSGGEAEDVVPRNVAVGNLTSTAEIDSKLVIKTKGKPQDRGKAPKDKKTKANQVAPAKLAPVVSPKNLPSSPSSPAKLAPVVSPKNLPSSPSSKTPPLANTDAAGEGVDGLEGLGGVNGDPYDEANRARPNPGRKSRAQFKFRE